MKAVELIIFDLDGTLIDSAKDIVDSINFTLKKLSLKERSEKEISSYIGTGVEDLIKRSLGSPNNALFDKALSIFESYYRKHFTDNLRLYPGVKEILEYFKDKRKAIVTNKKRGFTVLTLEALDIEGYFEDIICGDDIGCLKPSACPLDRIVNRLNIDKAKTIIVGDMDVDILAGKRSGVITCGVTYGIGKEEDIIKAMPDFIIDNIVKLKEIIL